MDCLAFFSSRISALILVSGQSFGSFSSSGCVADGRAAVLPDGRLGHVVQPLDGLGLTLPWRLPYPGGDRELNGPH